MSTSLIDRIYPPPDYRRTPLSLLRWWESRRLFYNRCVGAAGLVTLGGIAILWPIQGVPIGPGLVIAVVVYAALANLCYTLGWCAEVAARAAWGREAPDMGPFLFRQGLFFSVALTLLPLFVTVLVTALRVVITVAG